MQNYLALLLLLLIGHNILFFLEYSMGVYDLQGPVTLAETFKQHGQTFQMLFEKIKEIFQVSI